MTEHATDKSGGQANHYRGEQRPFITPSCCSLYPVPELTVSYSFFGNVSLGCTQTHLR